MVTGHHGNRVGAGVHAANHAAVALRERRICGLSRLLQNPGLSRDGGGSGICQRRGYLWVEVRQRSGRPGGGVADRKIRLAASVHRNWVDQPFVAASMGEVETAESKRDSPRHHPIPWFRTFCGSDLSGGCRGDILPPTTTCISWSPGCPTTWYTRVTLHCP
jgi:hypothetical protein